MRAGLSQLRFRLARIYPVEREPWLSVEADPPKAGLPLTDISKSVAPGRNWGRQDAVHGTPSGA